MSVGTRVTYTLPVEGAPVAVNAYGRELTVVRVEWEAYLFEGAAWRIVTAYSATHENASWHVEDGEIPSWVPYPPAAWFALADAIAAQADRPPAKPSRWEGASL